MTNDASIDELLAKQAIAEGIWSYCRALDRMDTDLYDTVFVPGARLDYGEHFAGTAEEFRTWVWESHSMMQGHSHQVTNILSVVDLEAGTAESESYVTVCLRAITEKLGAAIDIVDRGRYIDRWNRDDTGRWRIAQRTFVADISQIVDASSATPVTSTRDTADPSHRHLGPALTARRSR